MDMDIIDNDNDDYVWPGEGRRLLVLPSPLLACLLRQRQGAPVRLGHGVTPETWQQTKIVMIIENDDDALTFPQ